MPELQIMPGTLASRNFRLPPSFTAGGAQKFVAVPINLGGLIR